MYEYNATVLRVIDADTIKMQIDLGFNIHTVHTVRLAGINAPENSTEAGKQATSYVRGLLPLGTKVVITTDKDKNDKYGRYLAKIYFPQFKECLNDVLLQKGLAEPYL